MEEDRVSQYAILFLDTLTLVEIKTREMYTHDMKVARERCRPYSSYAITDRRGRKIWTHQETCYFDKV